MIENLIHMTCDNHHSNITSAFKSLLQSGTLVDVTLTVEGRHLKAHKVVLAALSSYFESLFTSSDEFEHLNVQLKDVQYNTLKMIIDYIYYGEVDIPEGEITQFLDTAKLLKIKGMPKMADSVPCIDSECESSTRIRQEPLIEIIDDQILLPSTSEQVKQASFVCNVPVPTSDDRSNVSGDRSESSHSVAKESEDVPNYPMLLSLLRPKNAGGMSSSGKLNEVNQSQYRTSSTSSKTLEISKSPTASCKNFNLMVAKHCEKFRPLRSKHEKQPKMPNQTRNINETSTQSSRQPRKYSISYRYLPFVLKTVRLNRASLGKTYETHDVNRDMLCSSYSEGYHSLSERTDESLARVHTAPPTLTCIYPQEPIVRLRHSRTD